MFWLLFSILVIWFTFLGSPNNRFIKRDSNKLVFRVLLILSLSILIAFGGIVGTDHDSYVSSYYGLSSFSISNIIAGFNIFNLNRDIAGYEAGYVLLSYPFYKFGFSAVAYFLVLAIITNTFLVKVLYRFKHPVFSIVLFITSQYYFQECNLVRQMLAVSIFLYALKYLENKDWKKYIIWVFVAASFHYSALFLLIFVFFCFTDADKFGYRFLAIFFAIWVASLLIYSGQINIDSLFGSFSVEYYQVYFDNLYGEGHEERPFEIRYNIIVFLVLITSFLLKRFKRSSKNIRYCYLLVFILGISFSNISFKYYWFYRVAAYFSTIFCFVTPEFLSNIKVFKTEKNYSILEIVVMLWYFADLIIKFIANPDVLLGSRFDIY